MKNSTFIILWRHFSSGRLTILLAAIIIATASLAAIAMVSGAVQNTIGKQARHSLASDLQIRGSKPIPSDWIDAAEKLGLTTARATQFRAMAFSADTNILTSVKAVSPPYPMLGELTVAATPYGENQTVKSGPNPGEAWLAPRLFTGLNIQPGDAIDIGEHTFTAKTSLVSEPDSLQSAFNAAPRIMIHSDDVAATGAIQLGSRVDYTLMVTGSAVQLKKFKSAITLTPEFRWRTIEESNERLASTINKATQFIRLGGILSIILASVGIALATRSYVTEQIPQVALLKTLGATPQKITRIYSIHIAIIAAVGTSIGLSSGFLIYQLIRVSIRSLLTDLADPNYADLLFAAGLSISVFIVFAAPYFLYLRNISPLRVLQQTNNAELLNNWRSLLLGSLAAFILSALFSANLKLTAYLFLGLALCCVLAIAGSFALLYASAYLTRRAKPTMRLGMANLIRHRIHTAPQIMMFSILFMLIFTLIMIRTSLLSTWQAQLPERAPNHYVYNIFDSQKQPILDTLQEHNIELQPSYPIFGGRLIDINGEPAKKRIEKTTSRVNYEREFGLTWSRTLGKDNKIVQGNWWPEENEPSNKDELSNKREPLNESELPSKSELRAESELQVSVEEAFAKGLELKVGDTLTLAIDGNLITATIGSVRSVQWDSMNLNFYFIFNRPPIDALNANWATSFYLEAGRKDVINQLARAHPTLSIIEMDQTIEQMKRIVQRVSLSIELITLLVLGSACVILLASIQATYRTRIQEGAILRTFGASKRTVQQLNLIEFGAIGLAAGLLATLGAETVLWLISQRILQTDTIIHWPLWLFGPISVMVIIIGITATITRKMHQLTPMKVLQSL
jgi:putative ABC transport system permease protein